AIAPSALEVFDTTLDVSSDSGGDTNPANNHSFVDVTTTPSADVSLAITDTPDPVLAGQAIHWDFDVTNNSTTTASAGPAPLPIEAPGGVRGVRAPAANGWSCVVGTPITCTRSSLAASTTARVTVSGNAPTSGVTMTLTASVATTLGDP